MSGAALAYPPGPVPVHCVPGDEQEMHLEDEACPCRPQPDEVTPGLWVHRGREERLSAGLPESWP